MSRIMSIAEIFEFTSKIRTKEERVYFLRTHRSPAMEYIVKGAFHPDIHWMLPTGSIPYRAASDRDTHALLYSEAKKLRYFVEGIEPGPVNLWDAPLNPQKRFHLFIKMLETVHPDDAKVLIMVKDKKLDFPFLTYQLFQEAFPEWLPVLPDAHTGNSFDSFLKEEGILDEVLQKTINKKAEVLIKASSSEFAKLTGEDAVRKALENPVAGIKGFQKGHVPHTKGKPMSEETKAKIKAKALERSRLAKEASVA